MGNQQSYITPAKLSDYENTTFFTKAEVLKVLKMFKALTDDQEGDNPIKKHLSKEKFSKISELRNNPFRHRIVDIYSRNNPNGMIGFEEYLDFLSVFSEEATREVKAFYAFKIYDFDGDGYVGKEDTKQTIRSLVGKELQDQEVNQIVDKIFEECDIDGDEKLSFVEFEHILSRADNFESTFRILIF